MSRTIIITGASRGIGKAIALRLAKKDINIVINCAKNKEQLELVYNEIIARGASCQMYVGDMGIFENVKDMFDMTHDSFGPVDTLINNAGISIVGLFQDMKPEEWQLLLRTNLDSVYNCCHFAVNDMLHSHKGHIVNISSVWGVCGASCEVAYSASKGAVNAMTRALAKELAPSGISVNAIACGAIETSMNAHLSLEETQQLIEEIPAGRLGKPEDAAELVYSIINGSSYLTGQVIRLDGGWI
ncbi:MAG: SDR family NAD(P)-dependent oxidoreductase [Eubacteriales bacterium]|nr:SDR family NAD(P)-dependent oxidoreductase [Eubacteriales bacterium]